MRPPTIGTPHRPVYRIQNCPVGAAVAVILKRRGWTVPEVAADACPPDPEGVVVVARPPFTPAKFSDVRRLRLAGFRGGVLVVCGRTIEELAELHPILRWGEADTWGAGEPVVALIDRLAALGPMEPEDLELLRTEIDFDLPGFEAAVAELVADIRRGCPRPLALERIRRLADTVRQVSPDEYSHDLARTFAALQDDTAEASEFADRVATAFAAFRPVP